jgi:Tol biopolymer transport system component
MDLRSDVALSVGARVGPYEISGPLGAGGMGEVYKAIDTNLKRAVAIKVLPRVVAEDSDRLSRLHREAEMLAALNNPHIAQIYGLEKSGGITALVMELVEGPTLEDRLRQGRMRLVEVLAIARQIALALEAAHERNIIHRDLKPANVKVRPDGIVKVLDFGLSRALETRRTLGTDLSQLPTIAPTLTHAGMILGTTAYMPPEQARGSHVDQRADIWAFGCVVFEMLTGQRAFRGDTVTDTLVAVVSQEPDWAAIPSETPDGVRRLLVRCLRKDPKDRLHHVADARIELDEPTTEPMAFRGHPVIATTRRRLTLALAVAIAVATLAIEYFRFSNSNASLRSTGVVRFTLPPPAGVAFDEDAGAPVATISPDGTRLALVYNEGVTPELFTRRLADEETKRVPGVRPGGSALFFSPDGQWIGFEEDGTLKKLAVDAGTKASILDVGTFFAGAAWGQDDTIVYTPSYNGGMWSVPAAGGSPRQLTTPDAKNGELAHHWPQVLPGGKTILFTTYRSPADRSRVELYSVSKRARSVLVDGGFNGRYVSSGHVLFSRGTTVFALPFDLDSLKAVGQPVPVLSGIAVKLQDGNSQFSVSDSGTLAYISHAALKQVRQLAWVDRTGHVSSLTALRRRFDQLRLSPNGRQIAVTIRDEQTADADVWVYDLRRDTFSRITTSPTTQSSSVWSADGQRLFFLSEDPIFHVYNRASDGTGEPTQVIGGPFDVFPETVSPDGRFLVYSGGDTKTRGGIRVRPLLAAEESRVFVDTAAQETEARFSPDGRWISFTSDETGRNEIYIRGFPEGAVRVQVSSNGGDKARWSRQGGELFFREGDHMMVAPVRNGEVGRASMLFTNRALVSYDVAADGRFVAVLRDESLPPAPVNIVLNWFDELQRLAPRDK